MLSYVAAAGAKILADGKEHLSFNKVRTSEAGSTHVVDVC